MRVRTAVPLLCTLLFVGFAPVDGGVEPGVEHPRCESSVRMDRRGWQVIRTGRFAFRLPPVHQLQEDESIDSDYRQWRSPGGKAVTTDYGLYSGPFQAGPHGAMREPIIECKPAGGTAGPQLVIYRTRENEQAVGLYWVVPGGRTLPYGSEGQVQREALRLEASSPDDGDLAELLAIARSVALRSR